MPHVRGDWCSWNVRSDNAGENLAAVTYWISRIQNLKDRSVFVTVNPPKTPGGCFFDRNLSHPIMDMASESLQKQAHRHQGIGNVFYCGAWLRHGFHEDGFITGIHAAKQALGEFGKNDYPGVPNLNKHYATSSSVWNHIMFATFLPSDRFHIHYICSNLTQRLPRMDTHEMIFWGCEQILGLLCKRSAFIEAWVLASWQN